MMKYANIFILGLLLCTSCLFAQEIPINELLYPVNDFAFTLAPSGKYMASVKKYPDSYAILITDIKGARVKSTIPLGQNGISNLHWISENRISYEQLGVLFAINIDGTENQLLMSIWKNENRSYYSTSTLLKNLQMTKMVTTLKDDYEHILVETRGIDDYPIIYKLNIFTGEKEKIEDGDDEDITDWLVDRKGQVRLGIQNDDGKIKFFTKNIKGKWKSTNELHLDIDGNSIINQKLNFLDFDYDTNVVYLASSIDNPRWHIVRYDIQKKTYIDTVLQDEKYDIGSPLTNDTKLLFLDSEEKLVGIRYEREKPFTKWFSKKFQAYQDTLKAQYPEYYAEIFDWNNDASIILVKLFSDVDPGHIVIYNAQTNKSLFFCSYAKGLLQYEVSKTKLIKYTTRDGYEIEGYLNLPLKGENNLPFIVIPHGGPWERDRWCYDPIVQFFTNQGYGVLKMNFRGSTGYGIHHLLAGIKQISTVMIDDIADGAKWLVEQKYADSANIFLYGHSYGGYAALQSIIRYPEIYRGAVSVGAPTDINKLMDYYKDQKNKFNYEFWKTTIGDPKHDDDFLDSISTIYNIKKIKRPILLFHGEKDQIVPVSQTENFIKKAEDLGRKIEYKIIKDEDHSISANHNIEFILRKSIQFFKENGTSKK
jgi:dipeptidyl aminopeptidase/acylaminoacyl peptidase